MARHRARVHIDRRPLRSPEGYATTGHDVTLIVLPFRSASTGTSAGLQSDSLRSRQHTHYALSSVVLRGDMSSATAPPCTE